VFFGEALHTFQFDDEYIFDEDISKVIPYIVTLVRDCKGSLRGGPDTQKGEFSEQSTLINFLEESRSKSVGNLEDGAKDTLSQRIESAFIGGQYNEPSQTNKSQSYY